MKTSDLLKVVPVAAMAISLYSTSALAGATNRDGNTAATPGPKATTTTTPADGATGNRKDMRRGTTRTENMDTPNSASDLERAGSGSSGGTGSTDSEEYQGYRSPNSSAEPGAGSTPENTDSGYDLSTGNTSGSSTGAKDSAR